MTDERNDQRAGHRAVRRAVRRAGHRLGHRIGPETERLLHRAFTVEDAEALHALNGNPEVMRFTGEPLLASVAAARAAIAAYPDFDTVGYGRWACVLKRTGTVIGFCGLKHLPDLDAVDVGFRFLPEHWGRGLATEACAASLTYGFDVLGLDRILGLVLPDNTASIRVLEKVGMHRDGNVLYDGLTVLRYAIERTRRACRRSAHDTGGGRPSRGPP